MRIVSVVGARPQFIKLAPVCRAIADLRPDWEHRIVHTGQHYDYGMSEVFFEDLGIPRPDVNLNIGSGRQGAQTGAMLAALEEQFVSLQPSAVVVYGDTNSTLAASLAAGKLHIPQFHVEAGLRSFDRRMPEEINRIVADHCADLLLAPTAQAVVNLQREGLGGRTARVGDVMYDAVLYNADIARQNRNITAGLDVEPDAYAIVTIHRASNTEAPVLNELMETLAGIAEDYMPVLFPMHPRTRSMLADAGCVRHGRLCVMEPQSYLDMLALVMNAKVVLTDSGGLQKEAAFLGIPCITLRDTTEWVETLDIGANRLTGLCRSAIRDAIDGILREERPDWSARLAEHYGNGRAAEEIVAAIAGWYEQHDGHVPK